MPGATNNSALLRVSHLHCRFGARNAVVDVSFELQRGHILGLLGPNGAGKTTTMNAICGVRAPTSGGVWINGQNVHASGPSTRARLGYLPEHPPLYTELTVTEYLRFCARLRGIPRRQRATAIGHACEVCGLDAVATRLIDNLSQGFQQRVGIAQAILHSPDLLVLDEPTVGLDPNQIRDVRSLIRQVGEDRAVLLSTHILAEVEATCDEVVVLHEGRVALRATMDEFTVDPGSRLEVSWARAPCASTLAALRGVTHARAVDDRTVALECTDRERATQSVLAASLQHGWELQELIRPRQSLESKFVALTQPPPPHPGHIDPP